MENTGKSNLTAEELANKKVDTSENENSKNKGSSQVDTRIHQQKKDYGRTTDTTGVGHEPGTIPGAGL